MMRIAAACAAALLCAPALRAQTDQDSFNWSGAISAGHWISVYNLNGPVTVERGTGDKVQVSATKRGRPEDFDYVRFEVKKYGTGEQDVVICALWGDNSDCDEDGYHGHGGDRGRRNRDVYVEFRVVLPANVKVGAHTVNGDVRVVSAGSEVDAESVNGSVEVSTAAGPVNAQTVNGSVRASMGHFNLDSDLNFASVNGTVTAEFADDVNADVDLSTVNGRFLTDFPVTISGRIDPKRLRAKLGNGGPHIRLSTVNGNVELRKR
jgi:Putative adhesin